LLAPCKFIAEICSLPNRLPSRQVQLFQEITDNFIKVINYYNPTNLYLLYYLWQELFKKIFLGSIGNRAVLALLWHLQAVFHIFEKLFVALRIKFCYLLRL